jgi:hypothetical protein
MGDQGVIRMYELPEVDENEEIDYKRAVYNSDGSRIACYGADAIVVWSTGDCSQPVSRICIDQAMAIEAFSLDCDRDQMAAFLNSKNGWSTAVKYWKIDTGEEIKSLQITSDRIYAAALQRRTRC